MFSHTVLLIVTIFGCCQIENFDTLEVDKMALDEIPSWLNELAPKINILKLRLKDYLWWWVSFPRQTVDDIINPFRAAVATLSW